MVPHFTDITNYGDSQPLVLRTIEQICTFSHIMATCTPAIQYLLTFRLTSITSIYLLILRYKLLPPLISSRVDSEKFVEPNLLTTEKETSTSRQIWLERFRYFLGSFCKKRRNLRYQYNRSNYEKCKKQN